MNEENTVTAGVSWKLFVILFLAMELILWNNASSLSLSGLCHAKKAPFADIIALVSLMTHGYFSILRYRWKVLTEGTIKGENLKAFLLFLSRRQSFKSSQFFIAYKNYWNKKKKLIRKSKMITDLYIFLVTELLDNRYLSHF